MAEIINIKDKQKKKQPTPKEFGGLLFRDLFSDTEQDMIPVPRFMVERSAQYVLMIRNRDELIYKLKTIIGVQFVMIVSLVILSCLIWWFSK